MPKATSKSLVLAFDIGTSSLRTSLFDSGGRRFEETTAQKAYRLDLGTDGKAELAPDDLRGAAVWCLGKTLGQYRLDHRLHERPITLVGASCFWHSLVGVDTAGRAITPIITWADSRCSRDAEELRQARGAEKKVHRRTGCMLRASFWPAKLHWLRRTQPRLFRRVAVWMSPAEWLFGEFVDQVHCGFSMASGTGLFRYESLDWDSTLLKTCQIRRDQLPELGNLPGRLRASRLPDYPELEEADWYPAIGDGAASNLGSGATRPGVAAINYGTSAAVRVLIDSRQHPKQNAAFGLFAYRLDENYGLIGGAVSNAGNLRQWCLRELRLPEDSEEVERVMAERPLPQHGLRLLPFWVSERAPTWNDELRGAILGMRSATTAWDVLQAASEAVALRLASIARLIEQRQALGKRGKLRYLVSGGIQHSDSSMQRLADVLGSPIEACVEPEASLRGAALFALSQSGGRSKALAKGRVFRPRAKAAKAYATELQQAIKLEQSLARLEA